ncbi:MAG: dUTP diphosphatase [Leptospira sp.]|nr:dUTP diphosphatase [Leptospira sp.]
MQNLPILRLHPKAELPAYKTEGSAGMDLAYIGDEDLLLPKGEVLLVPTGLAIAIPKGYEGQIRPRSGFSTKNRIIMPNAPGTIDSDYRGEVKIPVLNLSGSDFRLEVGTRIAQIIFQKVELLAPIFVASLDETERGMGGFGSTGK